MPVQTVATAPDGSDVHEVSLQNDQMSARLLTFGASLRDLRLEGIEHPLVLGFDAVEDYFTRAAYLGPIVGPVANRIRGGCLPVGGQTLQLDQNEQGANTLHGGRLGCAMLNWQLEDADETAATFALTLPDGHMGFPGPITIKARYNIHGAGLELTLAATSEVATVCTLAPHPYFNLDGSTTIEHHRLMVHADQRLPLIGGLPSGAPVRVAKTSYDLRTPQPVPLGLDDHFCLSDGRTLMRPIASLEAGNLRMDVQSTEAGLQIYDAGAMDLPGIGLDGRSYGPRAGVALEPHAWVDAPNQPWRAQVDLLPDEPALAHTRFEFTKL
ncbi:aldose 1-epimerase [Epibacterium ulvae]|uniref:Aldose 1-epimerase n=1 Tax=Epibacterium ulvae TaxID=1156985 RepID=A0A1G5PJZ6_9RHOB|nr:aldose epimerase family protein [Epibacterium ulvae]SCZ49726.1 aldose 1-epimerase [Epibacterium ulvae]